MDRLTLRFRDAALEAEYQGTYPAGMRGIARFGIVLAVTLFALFGFLDPPTSPETFRQMWMLRAGIVSLLLALLAASYSDFFYRHMQLLVSLAVMAMAAVNTALQVITDDPLIEEAYSFILLMIGTYTVLALQFIHVLQVIALIMLLLAGVTFISSEVTILDVTALLYAATAMALVLVGSYLFDSQRRLAFHVRKQLEAEREESHRLALHDALTGLPNRRLLMTKIDHALARDRRSATSSALLFLDLDGFKKVNDTLGHDAGDVLLVEVARRLKSVVREVDTTARLGGDEFVVLFEGVQDRDNVERLVERVMTLFEKPVMLDDEPVTINASIGIALHPGDGEEADQLLVAADKAMYAAKKRPGTTFTFHSSDLQT